MKKLLPLTLLLALGLARPAAAQTRRAVYGWQLWPEGQAELALTGNDYLLLAGRGQHNTDNNGFRGSSRFLGFDERRVSAAYEHFWTAHWSGGATLGYVSANNLYVLVPELLLRHRSPLGPLTFGQRLSFERTFAGPAEYVSQNVARLRLDLEKVLPVGRLALRPRLSYQADTRIRFLKAETDPRERTIQFTSLRGEVGCRLSPSLDVTPWLAYQTSYGIGLAQVDAMGNVTIPAGRFNAVSPVLGVDARFTILRGRDAAARQQLPTQH